MNNPLVVCFGEVLWDCFPDQNRLGGAPLNVALRLLDLGANVTIISALGNDSLGKQALEIINARGLASNGIQQSNKYPTGEVQVHLDKHGSATYTIAAPVAWDHICETNQTKAIIQKAQILVFGSLVGRAAFSLETLKTLLGNIAIKIFDVNLRAPHYNKSVVLELLNAATAIKINDEELALICEWLNIKHSGLEDQLQQIAMQTNTGFVCVTLGKFGAAAVSKTKYVQVAGYKIKVQDTVGAGDSFLATLINGYFIQQRSLKTSLLEACAMGALVASKKGATAPISIDQLQALIRQSQ